MGDVYWSIHAPLIARIAKELNIKTVIETGTHYGVGTLQLAALFDKVWTIENDPVLVNFFRKNYAQIKKIQMSQGSSPDILVKILPKIEGRVLFFLDAHWFPSSPRSSFHEGTQCPVMHELQTIHDFLNEKPNSVVMIDDAHMFLKSLPPSFNTHDFPRIGTLMQRIKESIDAEFVDVMDDVIIAGTNRLEGILEEYEADRKAAGAPYINR